MQTAIQLISVFTTVGIFSFGIFQFFQAEKNRRLSRFAEEALNRAYEPLEPLVKQILFKNIKRKDSEKTLELLNLIAIIKEKIHTEQLETYLDEILLIKLGEVEHQINNRNRLYANASLQEFSTRYWKLYNAYRKSLGMPKRTRQYRFYFNLTNKKDSIIYFFQSTFVYMSHQLYRAFKYSIIITFTLAFTLLFIYMTFTSFKRIIMFLAHWITG
ncbi:hypothetical protein HB825_01470 [Listeria booriae]|uniref:hypothetical protein n=1 Tax=Listeria booriae TaxID=1552123 RepID=UPI00164D48B7|nr:hypothetical protein [Listeria booriae]MBC6133504.1 hypothetical protein [Listeria booriae]